MLITSSLTAEEMELRVTSMVLNFEEGIRVPDIYPAKLTQLNLLYSMTMSNTVVSSNHVLTVLKRLPSEIWKIQITSKLFLLEVSFYFILKIF